MNDADTLNQSEQQIEEQNTNAEEEINEHEINDNTQEADSTDTDSSSNTEDEEIDESDKDDDGNREPTTEELNALSDEEFTEYLETGKLPQKTPKTQNAKIISKPESQPKSEPKVESKSETTQKASKSSSKTSSQPDSTNTGIDYESAYKAIFKTFKANGKEITPKTVDDVISLMQMGANYTKKMQLLAPMKKAIESLNHANIGEDDLNFLIDIHKGDKEAIKQLLEKHKVDVLDLNMDEKSTYVNNKKNIATDKDVEFADALLDANDSLPKIREILDNKWDTESRAKLLKDPKLMTALHEEIQLNRFDKVQEILEREKMFGRYKGVSDIDAYIDIVTKLVNEEKQKAQNQTTQTQTQTKSESKPTKPIPDKNKAAPTRAKTNNGKSTLTVKDLMSMSDDEFNKLSERDLV